MPSERAEHGEVPSVPGIACGKCGTEHHIDATTLPEQGRCRECFGFLRRPKQAEYKQFAVFLLSNMETGGESA